jgi:hypothetical protein
MTRCFTMQTLSESQYDLRLKVSSFHNIGNSLRAAQIVQENKSIVITTKVMTGVIKNKYQKKKLTTDMNKKNSLMNIVKILEMITTKLINSLMMMHIVNILRMITIN